MNPTDLITLTDEQVQRLDGMLHTGEPIEISRPDEDGAVSLRSG